MPRGSLRLSGLRHGQRKCRPTRRGSQRGIQQARKKKPRYYALVAKGADVVGLIVQKKAISAGVAAKAKTECKGNLVIQGVCQGDGPEFNFEVLEAEPSIKAKKIKDFISERAEITLKRNGSSFRRLVLFRKTTKNRPRRQNFPPPVHR